MKGQFMLISAIVVGIIIISTANVISEANNNQVEGTETAYLIQDIRDEAEKIDVSDRKQRENFENILGKTTSYSTQLDYWSTEDFNCLNVTLTGFNERLSLRCISRQEAGVGAVIEYSPESPTYSETVTFNGTKSKSPHDGIDSYQWEIGNDSYTGAVVQHSFEDPGEYDAELLVRDGTFSDTERVGVTVSDHLKADVDGNSTVYVGDEHNYSAEDSVPQGGIDTYTWRVDGTKVAEGTDTKEISYTFDDAGNHTVEVRVNSTFGTRDTAQMEVNARVDADMAVTSDPDQTGLVSDSFEFSSNSEPSDQIQSYQWDFDDGNTATGETVTHSYSSTGTYNVTLLIEDTAGNTDTDSVGVTVTYLNPRINAPADEYENTQVEFDGSGSEPSAEIQSYSWDFDDGSGANGETVTHSYNSPGTYNVDLTVTNQYGDTATATHQIEILESTGGGGGIK